MALFAFIPVIDSCFISSEITTTPSLTVAFVNPVDEPVALPLSIALPIIVLPMPYLPDSKSQRIADAAARRAGFCTVFNIAGGERCRFEAVPADIDGDLITGDDRTLEVSISLDPDIETTIPRTDSRLLYHTGIVSGRLGFLDVDIGEYWCTCADWRNATLTPAQPSFLDSHMYWCPANSTLRSPPTVIRTVLPATSAPRILVSPPLTISTVSPALEHAVRVPVVFPLDFPRP